MDVYQAQISRALGEAGAPVDDVRGPERLRRFWTFMGLLAFLPDDPSLVFIEPYREGWATAEGWDWISIVTQELVPWLRKHVIDQVYTDRVLDRLRELLGSEQVVVAVAQLVRYYELSYAFAESKDPDDFDALLSFQHQIEPLALQFVSSYVSAPFFEHLYLDQPADESREGYLYEFSLVAGVIVNRVCGRAVPYGIAMKDNRIVLLDLASGVPAEPSSVGGGILALLIGAVGTVLVGWFAASR